MFLNYYKNNLEIDRGKLREKLRFTYQTYFLLLL